MKSNKTDSNISFEKKLLLLNAGLLLVIFIAFSYAVSQVSLRQVIAVVSGVNLFSEQTAGVKMLASAMQEIQHLSENSRTESESLKNASSKFCPHIIQLSNHRDKLEDIFDLRKSF